MAELAPVSSRSRAVEPWSRGAVGSPLSSASCPPSVRSTSSARCRALALLGPLGLLGQVPGIHYQQWRCVSRLPSG